MSGPDIAALSLVALVGSATQSATGFGVALPLSPVAFGLLSPRDAVLTVAAASLMNNVLVLATRHRRLAARTGDAALLISAAVPGLLVGALVVSRTPKPPIQLAVGLAILISVLFRLHEPGRISALAGPRAGAGIGLFAGVLTTTIGINGPPLVTWLSARGATITQLRDTLAIVFLTLNAAAIPSLTTRGGTIPASLLPALAVSLTVGHVIGLRAHDQLPPRVLNRALIALLTAAGIASAIAASLSLL